MVTVTVMDKVRVRVKVTVMDKVRIKVKVKVNKYLISCAV